MNENAPRHSGCLSLLLVMLLLFFARTAWAQDFLVGDKPTVTARLVADRLPLVAGSEATFALELTVAPGWHIQSPRPYDPTLIATSLAVEPVPGLTFKTIRYPVAKDIPSKGLSSEPNLAVYEGQPIILLTAAVAPDTPLGSQTVRVTLTTQACDDKSCLPPADTTVTLPVEVAAAGATTQAQEPALFARAQAQRFLPPVSVTAPTTTQATASAPGTIEEVAAINARDYKPFGAAESADEAQRPLWQLVLFALLGGAILNVMPCVLPVIPLKILTLVQQAHGDRRLSILHACVFSLGIITLFVVLAVALGSYRLWGGQTFYGMQFQSPVFLIAMSFIILALALSMLNVWTINPPRAVYAIDQRQGFLGSFMMGVLATLLATPCSAPLLGPVLAWALVQTLPLTILTFALVGVGMAVPYILLAAFPAGLDRLPHAGRWSELLKQGLGLVMLGVALYLLLQLNINLWPWALTGALILAAVCWGWGQIPQASMPSGRIWLIRAIVVILGLALSGGVVALAQSQPATQWQPFTLAALDKGLAENRPVVIDWTASWCINCRAVEARVLHSAPVTAAFSRNNVLLLRADLSNGNPPAEALLARLRSRSIPVLAIFSPDRPTEPVVLRDLYTRERVIAEVTKAHVPGRAEKGKSAVGTP